VAPRFSNEDSPDKHRLVADANTIHGARTIALDPKTHRVFSIGTKKKIPCRRQPIILIWQLIFLE